MNIYGSYLGVIHVQDSWRHRLRLKLDYVQNSLAPNAWANQMSVKMTLVPDHVLVPTWWACSVISSFMDVAATLILWWCSRNRGILETNHIKVWSTICGAQMIVMWFHVTNKHTNKQTNGLTNSYQRLLEVFPQRRVEGPRLLSILE